MLAFQDSETARWSPAACPQRSVAGHRAGDLEGRDERSPPTMGKPARQPPRLTRQLPQAARRPPVDLRVAGRSTLTDAGCPLWPPPSSDEETMLASTLFQRFDHVRLDMVVTSAGAGRAVLAAEDRHKPGHVVRGQQGLLHCTRTLRCPREEMPRRLLMLWLALPPRQWPTLPSWRPAAKSSSG